MTQREHEEPYAGPGGGATAAGGRDAVGSSGEVVIRAADRADETKRHRFDVPATIAGALAALGTLLVLSSLVGAVFGAIGFQRGVDGDALSVGGLIGGLVVMFVACLVGGWVAGRMAGHRGGLHGLVAVLWLVALAALLAVLAAVAGDKYDVTDRVGLPRWFSSDAFGWLALGTGLLALALALLGGWLGGWLGARARNKTHESVPVEVVETRHGVGHRAGGIDLQGGNR